MAIPSINAASGSLDATRLVAVLATRTARLKAIVDHVPVILAEVEADGVFTLAEGDGLRLLGKRPADFVGHTITQLYPADHEAADDHRRALAGEEFSRTIDLGGRTWHATYEPTHDTIGQLTGFTCILLDATDAVRADTERRRSDDRLHLITGSTSIVLFAVDRDGVFTAAEGQGLALAGVDPSMIVGHTLDELPEAAQALTELHRRALAGEEFAATVDVGPRVWDMSFVPMRDAYGKQDGYCAVALNATKRVRSERDLDSSRRRETGVAELSRAALAGAALPDLIKGAAHQVACELGVDYVGVGEITPEGLRRLYAVGLPDDQVPAMLTPEPSAYASMRSVRAGQSVIVTDWDDEARFSKPDWLELAGVKSSAFLPIISQPQHQVFGFLGAHGKQPRVFAQHDIAYLETVANLLGDVISRQRAQDAAAQQAEQFRALAENSPNIIVRYDRNLLMVYVNGTVERLTGTPASKLIGHTLRATGLEEPSISAMELALRQVLRSGQQKTLDVSAETVLGPRTFEVRMAPEFGPDGDVQSVVAASHDITDHRRADEERLSVYRQLLAQQAQLQELVARLSLSHEQELEKAATQQRMTERERQILSLIVRGWTNREIAAELQLSRGNVKNQVSRLLQKLDVNDRTQAATVAVRLGLVEAS